MMLNWDTSNQSIYRADGKYLLDHMVQESMGGRLTSLFFSWRQEKGFLSLITRFWQCCHISSVCHYSANTIAHYRRIGGGLCRCLIMDLGTSLFSLYLKVSASDGVKQFSTAAPQAQF